MATVLKQFLWASNGHTVEKLAVGDVRDFSAAAAGLAAEGYISVDSVVVVPEAPVVIEPVVEPVIEVVAELEPVVAEVVATEPVVEVVAEPVAAEVVTEPVTEPEVTPEPAAEQPKRRKSR